MSYYAGKKSIIEQFIGGNKNGKQEFGSSS